MRPSIHKETVTLLIDNLNNNLFFRALVGENVTHLCDCPVLTKRDYDSAIKQLRTQFKPTDEFWQSVYWSPTGGSTDIDSKSFFFPWDHKEVNLQRKLMAKALSLPFLGPFSHNHTMANLFPGTHMYRSLELFYLLATDANITSLPISSSCTNQETDEFIEHFHPDIIAGAPITLADYAMFCLNNDLVRPKSAVLYASNPLFPAQEQAIIKAFNNPTIYSVYGSAETGPWAFHNSKVLSKNQFIIVKDIADVEIIDPDTNGYGAIVVTIKLRQRFPVVRYAIGDIGKLSTVDFENHQYCLLEVRGRNEQWLSYADLNIELKILSELLEHYLDWQIIQYFEKEDTIEIVEVRLLASSSNCDLSSLTQQLETLLLIHEFKGALKLKVTSVSLEQLIKSTSSQKVIKIVDKR